MLVYWAARERLLVLAPPFVFSTFPALMFTTNRAALMEQVRSNRRRCYPAIIRRLHACMTSLWCTSLACTYMSMFLPSCTLVCSFPLGTLACERFPPGSHGNWCACPPQKWSSWTGTRSGSHRRDDTQNGTLSRCVRSAECPEECADVWFTGKIRPLHPSYSPSHFAIFLLTQSSKVSSPFPLCPFYPPLVCLCFTSYLIGRLSFLSPSVLRVLVVILIASFSTPLPLPARLSDPFPSFSLYSLSLSETTSIAVATTSSAWPAWLRKSSQRSQTSSCPTWGPGGSSLVPCPLPTPPAPHPLSTPSSPGGWAGSNGWGCGCCQICCCLLPHLLLPLPVFHGKAEFASRPFTLHRGGCSAAAVEAARSVWPRTGGASTLLRWCIFAEVWRDNRLLPPAAESRNSPSALFFFPLYFH